MRNVKVQSKILNKEIESFDSPENKFGSKFFESPFRVYLEIKYIEIDDGFCIIEGVWFMGLNLLMKLVKFFGGVLKEISKNSTIEEIWLWFE